MAAGYGRRGPHAALFDDRGRAKACAVGLRDRAAGGLGNQSDHGELIAGRAAHSQNGVVVTASGAVVLMPVVATPPVMVHTTGTGASPRASGPMHVTLSW